MMILLHACFPGAREKAALHAGKAHPQAAVCTAQPSDSRGPVGSVLSTGLCCSVFQHLFQCLSSPCFKQMYCRCLVLWTTETWHSPEQWPLSDGATVRAVVIGGPAQPLCIRSELGFYFPLQSFCFALQILGLGEGQSLGYSDAA